ncbi:MAG: nuclear transport factor 2 family protein [Pseudomonadota bacterium]
MSALEASIREDVEDLHRFFVDWFGGRLERSALETRFAAAIDPGCLYITPDCERMDQPTLVRMMAGAFGANPDFRIAIRDVRIQRDLGDTVLATYVERQAGAQRSASRNGRFTTVLMTKSTPHRWLHIHETWLPEAEQAMGDFDF